MEESGYAGFLMPIEVYFKNKVRWSGGNMSKNKENYFGFFSLFAVRNGGYIFRFILVKSPFFHCNETQLIIGKIFFTTQYVVLNIYIIIFFILLLVAILLKG